MVLVKLYKVSEPCFNAFEDRILFYLFILRERAHERAGVGGWGEGQPKKEFQAGLPTLSTELMAGLHFMTVSRN